MDQPKHEKIVRHIILPDGTVEITSESYYETLTSEVVSHRKRVQTNDKDLLKDIVTALSHVVTDKTPTLVLTINQDRSGVYELVKQWVEKKENHNRR